MRDEFDFKETFCYYMRHFAASMSAFCKWLAFSLLSGVVIGGAGTLFHYCMVWANDTRTANPVLILLLPIAGLVIVGAYHLYMTKRTRARIWCLPLSIQESGFR